MVQVGGKGSIGTVEITDIMFSTIGPGKTAFPVHRVVLRRSTGSGWRYRDRVEHTRSCGPTCKLRDVGLPHKVSNTFFRRSKKPLRDSQIGWRYACSQ